MRLTDREREKIITTVSSLVGALPVELRLYGSRVDDSLKGGDIDLALVFVDRIEREKFVPRPHEVIAALKKELGDRRIDFSILAREDLLAPFWSKALQRSIVLWTNDKNGP